MSIGLILTLLSLGPAEATCMACHMERVSEARCGEALRIMRTESHGHSVGVHDGHHPRVRGRVFWDRAVARGLLHPDACDEHMRGSDDAAGWGIRGPHGLAAAYSVYLVGECVPAQVIDIPLISAVVTLRRLRVLERTYMLRTADARALAWRVGVGAARVILR